MRQIEFFPEVPSVVDVYFSIFLSQAITTGVLLLLAYREWTQRYLVNIPMPSRMVEWL